MSDENRARIDVKFAHLLSPALAEMMELQYYLEQCGTDDVAIKNVMNARLALEIYLESIFRIKFSRVFIDDTNSSPPKMEDSH